MNPFHLAIPVHDLDMAREFYGGLLQCPQGRCSDIWIDYDLYGHQLVVHKQLDEPISHRPANQVDGHEVPIPHFGVVLDWDDWQKLADKLKSSGISFIIEPYIRFEGQAGEQATMFFLDPSGNALEFKSFKNINQLFAT